MTGKPPQVEQLWFEDCPNHEPAMQLIRNVSAETGVSVAVERVEAPDEAAGIAVRFPGSPTIGVNGRDIEPGFDGCEDCTPRCRGYLVDGRFTDLPGREWLVSALRRAAAAATRPD